MILDEMNSNGKKEANEENRYELLTKANYRYS